MKTKILFAVVFFSLFAVLPLCAEVKKTELYHGGVYGQEFWLSEYRDGDEAYLHLTIYDGGPGETHFDNNYGTAYYINSKWFSNKKELDENIKACKDFFMYSLNFVYLNEIPKACAMELSCKLIRYDMVPSGIELIRLQWDCEDLISLFNTISEYHHHGEYGILKKNADKRKLK